MALSADAATGVQETVESTAAKLASPPPASSVLQPSTIDQAVSSVVDIVRVHTWLKTSQHLLRRYKLYTSFTAVVQFSSITEVHCALQAGGDAFKGFANAAESGLEYAQQVIMIP